MLSKFADLKIESEPQLIKNPFVCGSSKQIRISLDKDPIMKSGNTSYITEYKNKVGNHILHNELDPRLSYTFGNAVDKSEYTSLDKVDYKIPSEILNKKCKFKEHKDAIPISFIQIKSEEEGIEWYSKHYPKIPKDLLPIIARYHWGEPITKKGIKNEKKKYEKKAQQKGLKIEQKKVSLSFD